MFTFKDDKDHEYHDHHHEHHEGEHGKKKKHIGADGREHSHDSHLTTGFDVELVQVGEPGYQTHRCLDYFLKFNNHNDYDEQITKIILNLPWVPPNELHRVRLNYEANRSTVPLQKFNSILSSNLHSPRSTNTGPSGRNLLLPTQNTGRTGSQNQLPSHSE